MEANQEVNVGHMASDVVEFMMAQLPEDLEGVNFIETSIEILTLCLSEIIKAGYCHTHYEYALDKSIEHMKKDLGIHEER